MGMFARNAVIAGSGAQAEKLLLHLERTRPAFISVVGLFTPDAGGASLQARYPVLGDLESLSDFVRDNDVDDVILAMPWSADERIASIVEKLRELPLNVYLASDLVGFRLALRQPPEHFGDMPVMEIMGRPLSGWGIFWKAAEDYVLATLLIVLLSPLMLLIAAAIRLSGGPVIFRQKRLGFVNRVFYIYKFRTMHEAACSEQTTVQATRDDARVTRIGRFLRRTSLDELPQLFNVLNGTMSLVGPRPHAVDHNELFSPKIRGYFARHRVKPGITGWAQVNGFRGETDTLEKMEARVRHDIYYVENWSLLFDLRILAISVYICLGGRNAY
jgi:Undecaprenyl-phosphate glucose phosphotransferase